MYKKLVCILIAGLCLNAKAQLYTNLLNFNDTNGRSPYGSLISDGTYLYGMTSQGGTNGDGIIFKIKPNGTGDTVLFNFNGTAGKFPQGDLYYDGTYLYGMTSQGGANDSGAIFKIKPNGTSYTKLLDFNGTNGTSPLGSLISDGTYLYGMTKNGGTHFDGVIFKIKPDGTGYQTIFNFSGGNNGAHPLYSSLISDGTYLYGMTSQGGSYGIGNIFKIMPNGTGYTNLLGFTISNGEIPTSSLISDGTYLYGTTQSGGAYSNGIVFKIKPDGTGDTVLFNFSLGSPMGSLFNDGTYLYGTTESGGAGFGSIFKIKPNGTGYVDIYNFSNTSGENPFGSLISDGTYLYGMNAQAGPKTWGVLFKYCIASSCATNIKQVSDKNGEVAIYPNPTNSVINIEVEMQNINNLQATLYDVQGRAVKQFTISNSSSVIDVSNLSNGVYNLSIISNEGIMNKRVVISR
jgi:uncharacterized repeat protein (TIGR03803 family)